MVRKLRRKFRKTYNQSIDPDEIFMDSTNLPGFDTNQFEGRLEKPIHIRTFVLLAICFVLFFLAFLIRSWNVQVVKGDEYRQESENNMIRSISIFSDRGIIYDKNGAPLAWNEHDDEEFNVPFFSPSA